MPYPEEERDETLANDFQIFLLKKLMGSEENE